MAEEIFQSGGRTRVDRRSSFVRRIEQRIPENYVTRFNFESYKAMRMMGIKMETDFSELSAENKKLTQMMMPFLIDHGCMGRLEGLNPVPEKFVKAREDLVYDNRPLDPIPVMSDAVVPFIVKNNELAFTSIDGEGIYSHNEVSNLEADRAIRRMLIRLKNDPTLSSGDTVNDAVIRFKGDHFIIARRKFRNDEQGALERDVERVSESLDLRTLPEEEAHKLTSFRIDQNGRTLLDIVRMYRDEAVINDETIKPRETHGKLQNRLNKISELHPELKTLTAMIESRQPDEQSTLIGILEESLFDPRLQEVADKYKKKGLNVHVYKDMADMQNHIIEDESGFAKVDLASSLKSINSEKGFSEDAGDAFLTAIYDRMIGQLKQEIPNLTDVTTMRRSGDFYFIEEKMSCGDMANAFLKMFHEAPYAIIRKNTRANAKNKFTVSFVKTPPEYMDDNSYILPLMPIVGVDHDIRLQKIDPGTEIPTADAIRVANEMTFSSRVKVMDEEVRNMRPRLMSERLDKLRAADIEFMLFKMMNPTDHKRGLLRLRKLLNATDQDIKDMTELLNQVNMMAGEGASSSRRVNVISDLLRSKDDWVRRYANKIFDLTLDVISRQPYKSNHNGISTHTVETAISDKEEVNRLLDRTKVAESDEITALRGKLKRLINRK